MERKLRIKKSDFYIFLFQYIYIGLYFVFINVTKNSLIYCLIHGTVSSIVACIVLNCMDKALKRDTFSLAAMYLYVSAVYLHFSSVKYITNPLYVGYTTDQNLRLFGSIFSAIVIIIEAVSWNKFNRKHSVQDNYVKMVNHLNINSLIVWCVVIASVALMLLTSIGNVVYSSNSTMNDQISKTILGISVVLALLNIKVRDPDRKFSISNYYGYGPMIFVFLGAFIQSASLGKRHMFIVPVIMAIAGSLCLKKISQIDIVRNITMILPMIFAIFSIAIFISSNRFQTGTDAFMRELTFRFDLTDLAVTEAGNTSFKDYSIDSIVEPVELAIPGGLFIGNKNEIQKWNQYKKILQISGLYTEADYNDSVFSMGTEIGGYIGFVLIPYIIMIYYEMLDRWISSWQRIGGICKLAIIPYFCSTENVWQKFVLDTRTYFIILVVFYIILRLTVFKKLRENIGA